MSIEQRQTKDGVPRYVARVKHSGRLIASKTFRDRGDAQKWEHEQYRAVEDATLNTRARTSPLFSEVAELFLELQHGKVTAHSWRTDRDNLASVPAWFAALPIASIRESDVLAYLTGQLAVKARSTVARARTTLSAVFAYAVREEIVNHNPVPNVPLPPEAADADTESVSTFSDAELARTLAAQYEIQPRLASVTELLSLTGLHWSELRALRIGDLQRTPYPAVRVARAHSDGYAEKPLDRARIVPLTDRALAIAVALAGSRPTDEYLATTPAGEQLQGNRFREAVHWPQTAPGRAIRELRHYVATRWLDAGIPIEQVAEWLGHARARTARRIYTPASSPSRGTPRPGAMQDRVGTACTD
jgi:integrase